MKKAKKGYIAHKDKFKVEVKYSDKALKKDLIRFTLKKGKAFEITARELVDLIVPHFNVKMMSPLLVDNNIIRMVEVSRTLIGNLNRDMKAGDPITIPYKHLVPFQFAACEEAMNLGKAEGNPIPVYSITTEEWEAAKKNVDEEIKNFTKLQYKEQLDRIQSRAAATTALLAPEEQN